MVRSSIKIAFPELHRDIKVMSGTRLLDVMRDHGIHIAADCAGAGSCHKCRVKINEKSVLACETFLDSDTEVYFWQATAFKEPKDSLGAVEGMRLGEDARALTSAQPKESGRAGESASNSDEFAFAIDLGTTTLHAQLINLSDSHSVSERRTLNTQCAYGSDIISRIEYMRGGNKRLQELIQTQLSELLTEMLVASAVDPAVVKKIVIAANTAMTYILLDLDCESLIRPPFATKPQLSARYNSTDILDAPQINASCIILPNISAFIGGDAFAGIATLLGDEDYLLVDLGTNGEIIRRQKDALVCSSAAAGPAFEGAGIECGQGAVVGAVSSIELLGKTMRCKTIGDSPALGICGSGILDMVSSLCELNLVDESGLMKNGVSKISLPVRELAQGIEELYLSQQDLVAFQLAKSAIRTGVDVVLAKSGGVLPKRVYLSGGFGESLNAQSAINCGLLPRALAGRICALRNSALSGALKIALDETLLTKTKELCSQAQEVNLAMLADFNERFTDNLRLTSY